MGLAHFPPSLLRTMRSQMNRNWALNREIEKSRTQNILKLFFKFFLVFERPALKFPHVYYAFWTAELKDNVLKNIGNMCVCPFPSLEH